MTLWYPTYNFISNRNCRWLVLISLNPHYRTSHCHQRAVMRLSLVSQCTFRWWRCHALTCPVMLQMAICCTFLNEALMPRGASTPRNGESRTVLGSCDNDVEWHWKLLPLKDVGGWFSWGCVQTMYPWLCVERKFAIEGAVHPSRGEWLPTPVFLSGEFHEQRSLVGYSSWCCRVGHDWTTNTLCESTILRALHMFLFNPHNNPKG